MCGTKGLGRTITLHHSSAILTGVTPEGRFLGTFYKFLDIQEGQESHQDLQTPVCRDQGQFCTMLRQPSVRDIL
jgi:hypothetical protein